MLKNIILLVGLILTPMTIMHAMDASTTFGHLLNNTKHVFVKIVNDPLNHKKMAELKRKNALLQQELQKEKLKTRHDFPLTISFDDEAMDPSSLAVSAGAGILAGIALLTIKSLINSKSTTSRN